jgi:hypothetical protein
MAHSYCSSLFRRNNSCPPAAHPAELIKDYQDMALEDFISASHALNNYLDRIQSLSRAQRFMYQNQTTIEQALEELKDLPFDVD